jgi:hypothetical protein
MESLQAMLGLTITYGLRSKKASVLDNWVPLKNNCAANYVIIDENDNDKFIPIPAASACGFNLSTMGRIHCSCAPAIPRLSTKVIKLHASRRIETASSFSRSVETSRLGMLGS